MIIKKDPLKRYYTIGEVADLFGLSSSLIRFWESEFDFLKPHKNSKGDRRFTPENIEQLQLIHHLVKERGFTLAGAKKEIRQQHKYLKEKLLVLERLENLRDALAKMKEELAEEGDQDL